MNSALKNKAENDKLHACVSCRKVLMLCRVSKRVRLKEVAERAGVAVNTASTILNRRPNSWASKETEARVFAAAAEMGYRPNKTARALRSGRFHAIGLIIQDVTNPFFCTIADELEAAVEERGYDLLVENCRSSQVREKHLLAELSDLEVDGSVLWLSNNETFREELGQMFEQGRNVVALGNGVPETPMPVDAVLSDFTQGLQDAVEDLCRRGHKRFGFLSAHAEGTYDGSRSILFQQMLAKAGIPASDVHLLRTGHRIDQAFETFRKFLGDCGSEHPTALVAMNDIAALACMRAATEVGLSVPKDLSIVGVDDIPLCGYLPITLSSIRQRYKMITKAAADLLIQRIENPDDPTLCEPQQIVFPTIYTPRESVSNV
jgi:LacI family transcriptional regulator